MEQAAMEQAAMEQDAIERAEPNRPIRRRYAL